MVAVNKWDGLQSDQRDQVKMDLDRKLDFLSFAKTHFVSALKGTGISQLMKSVDSAYAAATAWRVCSAISNMMPSLATGSTKKRLRNWR